MPVDSMQKQEGSNVDGRYAKDYSGQPKSSAAAVGNAGAPPRPFQWPGSFACAEPRPAVLDPFSPGCRVRCAPFR